MLNGVMLLWFVLTAMALGFIAIDIRAAPVPPVMKWGFVLLTAYTGPIGAFLYVLGCREPLPGLHERYIATRWRQVLGSTMHCVAGDGVGILAGAVVASYLTMNRPLEIALEYGLGFGFGWTIFQALFMRDMAGGSYRRALVTTFLPEFLSMNLVMTGMMLIASLGRNAIDGRFSPLTPEFWFVMSMALLSGFLTAYPINWWLVAKGLKHGMMTVRHPEAAHDAGVPSHAMPPPVLASSNEGHADHARVSRNQIAWMTILSVAVFALAFVAQAKVKAVIDGLPLSSINRAVERIEHGDVASRTALTGWRYARVRDLVHRRGLRRPLQGWVDRHRRFNHLCSHVPSMFSCSSVCSCRSRACISVSTAA